MLNRQEFYMRLLKAVGAESIQRAPGTTPSMTLQPTALFRLSWLLPQQIYGLHNTNSFFYFASYEHHPYTHQANEALFSETGQLRKVKLRRVTWPTLLFSRCEFDSFPFSSKLHYLIIVFLLGIPQKQTRPVVCHASHRRCPRCPTALQL